MSFMLINVWHSVNNACKLKCLLEGLEFYKDTQMKVYDVTKLTAEHKKVAIVYSTEINYITFLLVLSAELLVLLISYH